MTERVEIISKEINGQWLTGLRLYLELPVTAKGEQVQEEQMQGPSMYCPGDAFAITFWGKRDLRVAFRKMLGMLDEHYGRTT